MPLFNHMATSYAECITSLQNEGMLTYPGSSNGSLWCNATFDGYLCWPAIQANTSHVLPCPPLPGLIPERKVIKKCDSLGFWAGKEVEDSTEPVPLHGYTDFVPCMIMDPETFRQAQNIAANARKLEFVGLSLSLPSLTICITIFSYFRRLRVFRNQIHQQLMIAILLHFVIRLILYIDKTVSINMGNWVPVSEVGRTINSTKYLCETFQGVLEYLKSVAFAFMFIEGYYLHNTVVVNVFRSTEPVLSIYLIIAWGVPVVHIVVWASAMILIRNSLELEICLGEYYLQPEFWIMDGVRLLALVINAGFLLNIVRVLWAKVKENHNPSENDQLKKSVKAALMLIPLLGIPNIMQTVPFTPTKNNIFFFGIFTYCASFFYMFQGIMVAVLFCFTNKEVINVVRTKWERYRLRHQSAERLRRGSNNRAPTLNGKQKNSSVVYNGGKHNSSTYSEHTNTYRTEMYDDPPPYPAAAATAFCSANGNLAHHHVRAETDQSQKHELWPLVAVEKNHEDYESKFP